MPLRSHIAGTPRAARFGALAVALLAALAPLPASAQDADWAPLQGGQLRFGIRGDFLFADQRFGLRTDGSGEVEEVEGLAHDLRKANGAALFPGLDVLSGSLGDIMGDPTYVPRLGSTRAYLQASQVRVPFSLDLGVTSWFTIGATVPLVKSRVEGDLGFIATSADDLGVNPALTRFDEVVAFTDALTQAAAALPAGSGDAWRTWADQWIQAYGASSVFPAVGTPAADALAASVAAFNAALASAGIPQVQAGVPLADEILTTEALRLLLFEPEGRYGIIPLPTQLLWALGDVEVHARLQLLEGGPRDETGRPGFGLTALGTLVLPTGAGDETRAIFDIPVGQGLLGYRAGAAGWIRGGRLGLAAMGEYGITTAGEVSRRIAPPDVPLVPVANVTDVRRTPGNTLELQVRPTFSMAPALTVEGFYRFFTREADTYERVSPLPGAPAAVLPLPTRDIYTDASLLALETEATLHVAGGGLRFHPPEGDFPVEVWAHVQSAIAGSGGQTLRTTTLVFGGRATFRLWGR